MDFLSRTFTIHRTGREGGGFLFKSSVTLAPALHALRHQLRDYCREITSAYSLQLDSNREPLVFERKPLTTKLGARKCDIDRKAYNKQRNLCVNLIRREEKNFFSNINAPKMTDNKTLWKTVRPVFTEKVKTKSKITKKKNFLEKGTSIQFLKSNFSKPQHKV